MFKFLLSVFCLTDLSCCLFCCWFCCWFPYWFPWPWFSCGWFLWCGLPCCSIIYWYCFPSPSATSSSIELFTSFCKSIMALNIMSYLNSSFWSVLSSTGFTFCSDSLLLSIGISFHWQFLCPHCLHQLFKVGNCPKIYPCRILYARPRWLSWMRRPTGDQEVAGSTPAEVGNILSWRLIMKYFLRSFSPFRWFKKGSCQFLAKECAQYWLTA